MRMRRPHTPLSSTSLGRRCDTRDDVPTCAKHACTYVFALKGGVDVGLPGQRLSKQGVLVSQPLQLCAVLTHTSVLTCATDISHLGILLDAMQVVGRQSLSKLPCHKIKVVLGQLHAMRCHVVDDVWSHSMPESRMSATGLMRNMRLCRLCSHLMRTWGMHNAGADDPRVPGLDLKHVQQRVQTAMRQTSTCITM